MICKKCNHRLPDDSEFCQYCGSKIENDEVVEGDTLDDNAAGLIDGLSNPDITPDDSLSAILKFQAKATIGAMEANANSQPDNEGDDDFGLVPEKPIYTLALKSVDGEEEYLDRLHTESGEKIKYTRRGSTSAEGINGMIDIYDTFLPSGQPYKTIYINMYGAKASAFAPKGFKFASKITTTPVKELTPKVAKASQPKKPINKKLLITIGAISFAVITAILLIAFVVIPAINGNTSNNDEIIATFDSVEDFKIALKKDPTQYNGKRVAIKGYANPLLSTVYLFDNLPANDELRDKRPKIEVKISDDVKLAVLEKGDYINLNGVVTVYNGEIYLNDCTYSMIQINDEQSQRTITVALTLDFEPYEYVSNGEYVGIHIDLAKEIAKRNNWNVTFVTTAFENIINGVSNGTYDLAFGIDKTPEREEIVSFTDAYYTDVYYEMYAIFYSENFEEWSNYKATLRNMISDGTVAEILSKYGVE